MTLSQAELASMRGAVDRTVLSMTCTIQRSTVTGTDPHGQPIVTWADLTTGVRCFYWEQSGQEVQGPRINAIVEGAFVEMEARTDVHEGDRITNVVASDGQVMAVALEIQSVIERDTVTRLKVEAVR